MPVPPFKPQLDTDQEMMSQDTLGHVMVPSEPSANYILIHAQLVLAVFQGGFHGPAHTRYRTQLRPRRVNRCIAAAGLEVSDSSY